MVLVVAGHAQLLPGTAGPIGVTVFFALSGFLITTLLLQERGRSGRVSLRGFYARRARRLLPALGVYLVAVALLTPTPAAELLGPVFYMENWLMALRGFAPGLTSITWSLAIEEQFYLLWPLVVIAASALGSGRLLLGLTVAGTVIAPALRVLLWDGGAGQWRIYYGTDTRMDCLLIGCLLAIAATRAGVPTWLRRSWPIGVVAVALPLLDVRPTVHLWLPTVVAAGTCVVIASALEGGCEWLKWTPLRWLGRRSYALYLWHYPVVYVLARQEHAIPMWAAIVVSLLLAEVSWWIVERPFMLGLRASTPGVAGADRLAVRPKEAHGGAGQGVRRPTGGSPAARDLPSRALDGLDVRRPR